MMKDIGFTGTREGMTDAQKHSLTALLLIASGECSFHHGDCVGADQEAWGIVTTIRGFRTVSHPPINGKLRAWTDSMMEWEPKDYMHRNREIVEACSILIGCPSANPSPRSGTMATIRYARRFSYKTIIVINSDGVINYTNQQLESEQVTDG